LAVVGTLMRLEHALPQAPDIALVQAFDQTQ
jgi:hypothetical protein